MTATADARPFRSLHLDVDDRPFIVIWETTRACALVCAHCRADAVHHRDPMELSTDEGKVLLDDLAALGAPRPIVVLTGGDPFERPDLAELVAHGAAAGLSMALSPSVTPRLTREVLIELRDAGARAISLSLDGASASSHDGFRGVEGVFDATLQAAQWVREVGLRLQINTTVTADTVGELPEVLASVVAFEAGLWSVFFLVPTGRGDNLRPLPADEVEEVLHWLNEVGDHVAVKTTEAPHFRRVAIQRSRSADVDVDFPPGPLRLTLRAGTVANLGSLHGTRARTRPPLDVNAGRGFSFIDHHGLVYPSGFLPMSAGSVRHRPFTSIYRESDLLVALRDPDRLGGRCGRCELKTVCGGSRSHAFAVSGDPFSEDPNCAYQPPAG
ncbi:MAG: TIGR04053 family radical SAM/SPASM domain-containing protein [Microthrixaceae bacterium]|jgi:radical SAM protein|nr:TIGR04053 family radical SAM/SPASM domain-containing protein [Microthrixaceae bacterium]